MTRGQFERASCLIDEIDRFYEESRELFQPNAFISLNISTDDRKTSITVTDELLDTIKLWYEKKIGALEAELKAL